MSDEIPSHFEHRQRTKNLWLCAELWTDVFSMLSRADLVQRVEPVHRRFKEICEKKVRTIHLIRTADRFIDGLAKNMAEANQQYAHLAANDCPLAHQFRLIQMDIWVSRRDAETNSAAYKRRRRFQMCVMRHSLDLFRDCRLHLQLPAQKGQLSFADSSEYLAYLNILYAPGPGSLELTSPCSVPYLQMDELLRQPTVLQCNRLTLVQTPKNEPTAEAICHWIHWICPIAAQPTEAGKQEEKEEEEEAEEEAEVGLELLNFDIGQLRCLNILASSSPVLNSIEEVLDRCIQNLLQAERPTDRRPFVFSFCFTANQPLKELHVQNLSSAEVLLLENVESPDTGLPTANYRLSRWPIAQLGQMPEFNGRLFRSFGKFKSGSAAIEPTLVQIT